TRLAAAHHLASGKPYLLQGGAEPWMAPSFLSAPSSYPSRFPHSYSSVPARHVSCNTTAAATALGLALAHIPYQHITSALLTLHRRARDPGEDKPLKSKPMEFGTHHAEDVIRVLPELEGSLASKADVKPWEHFHAFDIVLTTTFPRLNQESERIEQALRAYPRCAYRERPLRPAAGIAYLRAIGDRLAIPDADLLLPVYSVRREDAHTLAISGFTPQRSIVAPSCVDWLGIVEGSLSPTFAATNERARWHGYAIPELKAVLEAELTAPQ
ncbi:MAG TPA: hypothetical protein VJB16_01345, partial [archaeon]|nr:hypothetical protein [archaeon]